MQFDEAGDVVAKVRWFFAGPDAKVLPVAPAFFSANYGDYGVPGLYPGEPWNAVRLYDKGARPKGLDGTGPYCGPDDWWEDGTPSDAPPLPFLGDLPACCGNPNPQGELGAKIGLAHVVPCFHFGYPGCARLTVPGWVTNLAPFTPPTYGPDFQFDNGRFVVGVQAQQLPGQKLYCTLMSFQDRLNPGSISFFNFVGRLSGDVATGLFLGFEPDNRTIPLLYQLRYECDIRTGSIGVAIGVESEHNAFRKAALGVKVGLQSEAASSVSGTVGVQMGLASMIEGFLMGDLGIAFGLVSQLQFFVPVHVGLKVGIEASLTSIRVGSAGISLGLLSHVRIHRAGSLGLKAGIAARLRAHEYRSVGFKVGVVSQMRARRGASIGVEAGVAGTHARDKHPAAVGVKLGLHSQLRSKVKGTVGLKLGTAGATFGGIVTACCPGRVVARILSGIAGGTTAFTATYSVAAGGWTFINPTTPQPGLGFTLKCVGSQWQAQPAAGVHCSDSFTVHSLTCGHPFALSVTTVRIGSICVTTGTYNFTFSGT